VAMTKAVARVVMLPIYDAADTTVLKTGLTLTCVLSKDGGGFVATTNAAVEVGTSGVYALTLTATEMDADLVSFKATAAGACDQVATLVTDDLAYIRAKTDTIGALAVTISSPVAESGDITLYAGDDYAADDSRAITAPVALADVPDLSGATIVLKCAEATWEATDLSFDATNWTITFELTAAETALVASARQSYEIEAALETTEHIITLATGALIRVADIPAIPAAP